MHRSFLIAAAVLFICGCATTKRPVTGNSRIAAKFDFSPSSRMVAGSANLTIALVRPIYITKNPEYYVDPFREMSISTGNDFEEMLTAKGFNIREPFGSRDEMVFNDKQNSDFAFIAEIDLQPNYDRWYKYSAGMGSLVAPSYKMNGEITFGGNLVLTASSPKYGEKIWKKNIALEKSTFNYTGSIKWNYNPSVTEELKGDNTFYNTTARELEKFYDQAMRLAWQQIE